MGDSSSKRGNLRRGLKAAIKAFGRTPTQFAAAGKQISCPHCGDLEFDAREVLMNTRGASFMNLDWLNHGATALTCRTCRRVEWYEDVPDPIR